MIKNRDDTEIIKDFEGLHEKFKQLYYVRLQIISDDFEIWNIKKVFNPLMSMFILFFIKVRRMTEYSFVFLSPLSIMLIFDLIVKEPIFIPELRKLILIIGGMSLVYWLISGIFVRRINEKIIKRFL